MGKKALAILYSPKSLIDFTWYYYTYGSEYKWDTLVLACDGKILIGEECEKSELFENIYFENINYNQLPLIELGTMFFEMFLYWLTRRKKQYVKKFFKDKVGNLDYDLHLICNDFCSLHGGLLECLGDEIETVILEDGMSDYAYKTKRFCTSLWKKISTWGGYLMCHMGYASVNDVGTCYVTDNTKYCDKYSIHPERMKYTAYKSINRLGDMSKTDITAYHKCLRTIYDIDKRDQLMGDVILYTVPIYSYDEEHIQELISKTVAYITATYHPAKVLIKKHPRDKSSYVFPKEIEVIEINARWPAELLIPLISCKKHIFMYTSTVLMAYPSYDAVEVLLYGDMGKRNSAYLKAVKGDLYVLQIAEKNVTVI